MVGLVAAASAAQAWAGNRDLQFRSINMRTGVIELYNFGTEDLDLSGWRFCTQDTNQRLRYTLPGALNGVIVEAGTSIFIHFNDDAPNDPDHFNRTPLGDWATPLDPDAYSLAIYFPNDAGFVVFGDGTLMADFMQWSIDGQDDTIADERSDEAVSGGVWEDEMAWIATSPTTTYIRLLDLSGGELQGPDDYEALDEMPDCNANGVDDFIDINFGFSDDANGNGIPDECEGCVADIDGDGDADGDDFFAYLDLFAAGDPGADLDGDGDNDAGDFFLYLDAFVQGC